MKPLKPWRWRSLPLAHRTGSDIFAALFLVAKATSAQTSDRQTKGIATLLESPYPTVCPQAQAAQTARYSICAGAPRWIEGRPQMWTPPIGEILPFLNQLLCRSAGGKTGGDDASLPFTGGWLGWLGYDLAWEIERLPHLNQDPLPLPIAYWYEPSCFTVLDHEQQILWLAATDEYELDHLQQQLESEPTAYKSPVIENATSIQTAPIFLTTQAEYEAAVVQAKKYIQAGDIFQTNLSLRFETQTTIDSWSLYRRLQTINPSPFASYWQTPWGALISCSPERLVQLRGGQVQTRPIAGTRPRGITAQQDQQLAQELTANPKENAEHIMLLDLERNDLGRVCQWGSVIVNELLTIERYSHVMHLVSNVMGTLKPDCSPVDLIRAMFPGGTITGCPKVRCMEIIEELEPVRRNLFYGSCGYLDWRGNLDLNILIRSMLCSPDISKTSPLPGKVNTIWGQVGAGIVADSEPEREWYESLQKAQAQLNALSSSTLKR
ncbi:MAG: anthranilate synthase component I [Cyanothece sp. SIO1E1]|nr:anthranilate synthase component I [Cyanothece sp. SIO1E1]